jgi:hypothetical protein
MKALIIPDHRAVTTVLSTKAGADDLGHLHQNITTVHGMKEPEDPSLPRKRMTMRTTKRRWERHALLAEFAAPPNVKDSNYPMISRNMTGLRSHNHGSQTIYKH